MLCRETDKQRLLECICLAKKAQGQTSPNPLVGAIIVDDYSGEVLSKAYHKKAGERHAEAEAIVQAKKRGVSLKGKTLYCSLEPCCHTNKKTPPCAQAIIEEGFSRVVIASLDPNPEVEGKGVELLRSQGVKVDLFELEEAKNLNKVFFHWVKTKRPYVHLKWAQTLDGHIADRDFNSKWISSKKSRLEVHELRFEYDGVFVGKNTLREDNPRLSARGERSKIPFRISWGSLSGLKLEDHFFSDENAEKSIYFTSLESLREHEELASQIEAKGVQVKALKKNQGLREVLDILGEMKVTSLLVEGGSRVLSTYLEEGLWNEATVYVNTGLLGGGLNCFQPSGRREISNLLDLGRPEVSFSQETLKLSFKR